MPLRLATDNFSDARAAVDGERKAFAAKLRAARAVLGWSQSKLAQRAGLTQRAVHKLEQGDTEPRRMTAYLIDQIWREEGLIFETTSDGFRLSVSTKILGKQLTHKPKRIPRFDAGVTSQRHFLAASR
jgi:transcriptional regulator with XRE-family HTH domain